MSAPLFTLRFEDWLHIVPVCHVRLEFATLVRRAIQGLQPGVVAVEFPANLRAPLFRAVARLPQLSVIVCPETDGSAIYLPVEPIDAGIEAVRSALEQGIEVALVDLDVKGYADHRDPLPDSYALMRIGAQAFYESVARDPPPRDPLDERREAAMAYHLQRLRPPDGRPVLLVCGLVHAEGVRQALAHPQGIPFARPERSEARVLNLDPRCLSEVLAEAPALQAVYELLRNGPPPVESAPELVAGRKVGPFRILDGAARSADSERRALLQAVARQAGDPPDRLRMQWGLFERAVQRWEQITGERLQPWQRDVFARYARNLALLAGRLVVDTYDFLLAVRGIGDENLLYEAWVLMASYPWQSHRTDLPTARICAEELQLGSHRMRIRPRYRSPRPGALPSLPRRRAERYSGEWLEGFDEAGFCSYPPEDRVIEGYARFLRKKGKALLSQQKARVEPFRGSLFDGIDMRETLRHWATEKQIWVREERMVASDVGSVVLIFNEDRPGGEEERYPYCMTWLGEHDQESDMAFYSTSPAEGIQGPGIARCEYGGLMMSHPPRRMQEVWTDPNYSMAGSKAERLLLAALDYSLDRFVVHVAARAPRSFFRTLAERLDRRIIHIPIGQLSPPSLKRLRVFHILAGRSKREIAKEYIW